MSEREIRGTPESAADNHVDLSDNNPKIRAIKDAGGRDKRYQSAPDNGDSTTVELGIEQLAKEFRALPSRRLGKKRRVRKGGSSSRTGGGKH